MRARLTTVSATIPKDEDRRDSAATTLGDVLYANGAKPRVSESEWVGLLQAIARGDQLALHALYGRAHRIVFTLIMRIVQNRDTAEELTVDVFHDVWKRAGSYDGSRGTVIGWIMNQARSRAIDRLRFEQRKKRTQPPLHEPDAQDAGRNTYEGLEASDQRRVLQEALADLTPGEREAIQTAFFSECSYADAAVRLNQPLGTVKTRIRSGVLKLRRALAKGVTKP
jgi:RNA polymerase sigma-70 factor, ECF subfamily